MREFSESQNQPMLHLQSRGEWNTCADGHEATESAYRGLDAYRTVEAAEQKALRLVLG